MDYAGQTMPIVDRETGEIREAQFFVGVLGASNFTLAEATWSQSLPDWTGSHVRMFEYFQGVSELVVPDNLSSGAAMLCVGVPPGPLHFAMRGDAAGPSRSETWDRTHLRDDGSPLP